jgi:hypothetical protein
LAKKTNLFFDGNKDKHIVYGKFLKQINNNDYTIEHYKVPSKIYNVDYKKLVDNVYSEKISEDNNEDTYIKKLICNVLFGMLEKSWNKKQSSYLFDNEVEACYNKNVYGKEGGAVYKLYEYDGESYDRGSEYHVFNISDKKTLVNGFRYIKELLLQHHNMFMQETYNTLKENSIGVYSVKSDAFTIHKSKLDKVIKLVNFGDDIGTWRISKTKTY